MSLTPPNRETKTDRPDAFATHADLVAAIRDAVAAQNKSATDDLLHNFTVGIEPVRRIHF